ncbi:pseudouridine synthase [uncultured Eudoraea sp.]|uniref:pseudouridine synthase n=1 Tax=uncultured Eudoraea sp. TaxID=1035614 RepID=UPI002623F807|nr:pseudouridine synthase [uncultured Eudoraea sp.]
MDTRSLHFKLYKPCGIISQLISKNPRELRKKKFLSELYSFPDGVMPIGRLDEKSEGLLLLTTDGKLSDTINRSGVEKEYYAQLDGKITDEAIMLLSNGVEIGFEGKRYRTKACKIHKLSTLPILPEADKKLRVGRHRPTSWISIILTEGKFRQVRKMTAAVGFPTLRLVRMRIGEITLENLLSGEVKPMKNLTAKCKHY